MRDTDYIVIPNVQASEDFIIEHARLMAPDVREKPGVWYRLNRWREEQITGGRRPTYGDLVRRGRVNGTRRAP